MTHSSLFFKEFNFYGGLGIKSIKGYQPAPAVLLASLMNTMLLAMKLTSTTTFKETRMTVLQFLHTAKEKDNAMIAKNWVQFLKCENFKKQGQPPLLSLSFICSVDMGNLCMGTLISRDVS